MISQKTDDRPFKMRGEWNIYNVSGHARLVSQARVKGYLNCKLVNRLSVLPQNIAVKDYCHIGVPKASK